MTTLAASALVATLATPAFAQQSASQRPCDRQCLTDIGERYLGALVAHDPKRDPIAADARYTENGQELKMPDGLWRTITAARPYRLVVADPETGMVGIFSTMEENGASIILSSRLKVRNHLVTQIETTVARRDSTTAAGAGAGTAPEPDNLKVLRPAFTQALAAAERLPRWQMIRIADSYFRALENNNGRDNVPPFADDCHRIENGVATTNRPKTDASAPISSANMGCKEAFGLGYYREDTRLRGMRFLAVDEERGLVLVNGFFDHDAALRSYKLVNGKTVTVTRTAPWTWQISEVFKIRAGQIWQVEAVLLPVPYGMKSGWDNGWKMPSYQEERERNAQ
jgi:hypothetical protein